MNKSKLFILLGIGVVFSSASFLYEYGLDSHNSIISAVLMVLDVVLLLVNLYYLWFSNSGNKGKSIVSAFLSALLYFMGISGAIMVLAEDNASLQLLLGTLKMLAYLSPVIVLLLPVIYVFALLWG